MVAEGTTRTRELHDGEDPPFCATVTFHTDWEEFTSGALSTFSAPPRTRYNLFPDFPQSPLVDIRQNPSIQSFVITRRAQRSAEVRSDDHSHLPRSHRARAHLWSPDAVLLEAAARGTIVGFLLLYNRLAVAEDFSSPAHYHILAGFFLVIDIHCPDSLRHRHDINQDTTRKNMTFLWGFIAVQLVRVFPLFPKPLPVLSTPFLVRRIHQLPDTLEHPAFATRGEPRTPRSLCGFNWVSFPHYVFELLHFTLIRKMSAFLMLMTGSWAGMFPLTQNMHVPNGLFDQAFYSPPRTWLRWRAGPYGNIGSTRGSFGVVTLAAGLLFFRFLEDPTR